MESELIEVAKIGGPIAITVIGLALIVYKIIVKILPVINKLHEAVDANTKATIINTKVSETTQKLTKEMYIFLKGLNGRLREILKKEKNG